MARTGTHLGLAAVGEKEPFAAVLLRSLDQVAAAGVTIRAMVRGEDRPWCRGV